jgi:hypothetical protein
MPFLFQCFRVWMSQRKGNVYEFCHLSQAMKRWKMFSEHLFWVKFTTQLNVSLSFYDCFLLFGTLLITIKLEFISIVLLAFKQSLQNSRNCSITYWQHLSFHLKNPFDKKKLVSLFPSAPCSRLTFIRPVTRRLINRKCEDEL